MAEFEQVEERVISGKGVLRVPESALDSRVWVLYLDLIRPPINEYKELNWNPPQSVYARLAYLREGYVQTFDLMRFDREQRTYINDITGQNLRAIKCAYEGILQTFFNLGNALNLPSISITNLIRDYESLALSWDEILFSCYGGTALQARFFKLDYDVCNPENDRTRRLPPPPQPRPRQLPGTPIDFVSPPYNEDDNDGGNTNPFQGDTSEPEQPPEPNPCDEVIVTLQVTFQQTGAVTVIGAGGTGGRQYAPIDSAFVQTVSGATRAIVRGGARVGTVQCNGASNFDVIYAQSFNPGNPIIDVVIADIEVVS